MRSITPDLEATATKRVTKEHRPAAPGDDRSAGNYVDCPPTSSRRRLTLASTLVLFPVVRGDHPSRANDVLYRTDIAQVPIRELVVAGML